LKLNILLSISAIYMALLGLGFLFAPEVLAFGVVPAGASTALIAYLRTPASTFLGIAVLNWMARNAEPSPARNAIVLASTVGFGLAAVLGVLGVLSGVPAVALVFAVLNLLTAVAFFWAGRTSM